MLEKEIVELREKLNNSIIKGEQYEIIYKLSIELDELIARYYNKKMAGNLITLKYNAKYDIIK